MDKLGNVQISDNNGITDGHLPIGEGTVDLASLVRQFFHAPLPSKLMLGDNTLVPILSGGKEIIGAQWNFN